MTSLKGYIDATYNELVEVLGEPTYFREATDVEDKICTEWEFAGYNFYGEETPITVYDWKDYDGGVKSRSGDLYRWNIGGTELCVVEIVEAKLKHLRAKIL